MARLKTLPADCTVAEAHAALQEDGAVIIRNLAAAEEVAAANSERAPWLSRTPKGTGDFVGWLDQNDCALALSTTTPEERGAIDLDDENGQAGLLLPGKWQVLI